MNPAMVRASLVLIGGALMVASGFVVWRRDGPGSTMSGLELASVLWRSQLSPRGAGWLAAGLVLVPTCGALAMLSAPFSGRIVPVAAAVVAGLVVVLLAVIGAGGLLPPDDWAGGPVLAVVGGVAVSSSAATIVRRRP